MRNTRPDMGHRGRGVCDTGHGTKYMMWGHGTQATEPEIQQQDVEGPFSCGTPACSGKTQFPPLTKACLCFASSSSLWMPKSGCVPEEWGPEYPSPPPAQTGVKAWGQGHGSGRACQVPRSCLLAAVSASVGGAGAGNFPVSRPPSCSPPWLPLLAMSSCIPGLRGERQPCTKAPLCLMRLRLREATSLPRVRGRAEARPQLSWRQEIEDVEAVGGLRGDEVARACGYRITEGLTCQAAFSLPWGPGQGPQ